ncbi:PF06252 family protein [Peptoanaerobacter stomatis]|uniref:PF06252 family protein n=1 Tax=Peptoanaerobacter stomatis TaxID=796937 RepID=J6H7H7_9FIRM|nr:phage protein GemA/Gp16 family protein [Peptoanaerobacter stomatis]EJU21170.1 PF06252 family protein [Peptoanaerobacter stomatis]
MMKISKSQIQKLYAIASKLNLVENGNKNDNFHSIVYSVTGKNSVSELTGAEFYKVRDRLIEIQNDAKDNSKSDKDNKYKKKTKKEEVNGLEGMTQGQCKKVWYLMYELEKVSPSSAKIGERLKGIIKKQLKIDVDVKKPFVWLTYKQGNQLIEILKKYVENVKT